MKNRVRTLCIIPKRRVNDLQIKDLQASLCQLYEDHFGSGQKLVFVWLQAPEGQLFLAGRPSDTCTIQIPVADGLEDRARHAFMRDVCSTWMSVTGCDKNQIICNAPDQSYARAFASRVTGRLQSSQRMLTAVRTLARLIRSKLSRGILTMSVNLSGKE